MLSYVALLISVASLAISLVALHRDRYALSVQAIPVENARGAYNLQVTASNSGKRAVSVNYLLIRPPGKPGLFVDFAPAGENRIEVNASLSSTLDPANLPTSWASAEELRTFAIFVQDAAGKQHKAQWPVVARRWRLTNHPSGRRTGAA